MVSIVGKAWETDVSHVKSWLTDTDKRAQTKLHLVPVGRGAQ